MPQYVVTFPNPVLYLEGHKKGQKMLTEMVVNAPTEMAALSHAIRVTTGDIGNIVITEMVEAYDPPKVDPPVEVEY